LQGDREKQQSGLGKILPGFKLNSIIARGLPHILLKGYNKKVVGKTPGALEASQAGCGFCGG
jgi:hypothetical protein